MTKNGFSALHYRLALVFLTPELLPLHFKPFSCCHDPYASPQVLQRRSHTVLGLLGVVQLLLHQTRLPLLFSRGYIPGVQTNGFLLTLKQVYARP